MEKNTSTKHFSVVWMIVAIILVVVHSSYALINGGKLDIVSRKGDNTLTVGRVPVLTNNGDDDGVTSLSEMGCGTWSWGNRILWDYDPSQDEEIYQAYKLVRKAGVTVFDTADSYGTLDLNGRAEVLLGQFERRYQQELLSGESSESKAWWDLGGLAASNQQSKLLAPDQQQQVATKFAPYPWRLSRSSFVKAAQESLTRLEQPSLAIAQAHWSTKNYLPQQESAIWNGLADCYDAGLAKAVGVSNYGPKQLMRVSEYMKGRNVPLATAQIQYSLMTYDIATQMNEACESVDCRLVSYSPICLGLLTGKYNLDNLPRQGNPRRQLFKELLTPGGGTQELIDTIEAIARDYGKSNSQVAINWALCKGTVPIPGCRTLQQAEENIGATGWRLAPDAVTELESKAAAVTKPMIQNIFQTK